MLGEKNISASRLHYDNRYIFRVITIISHVNFTKKPKYEMTILVENKYKIV